MTPIEPHRAVPTLLVGFAASVRRHPQRIAVKAADRSLTYRQLDEASDALAFDIQGSATGPNRRVAIFVERRTDVVVAAIAALKTGSCYVPLDPAIPLARLEVILDEAGPAVVVTSRALRGAVPGDTPVLCVDDPRTAGRSGRLPDTEPSPCAYIIFTSGTTGRPKGVQISHGNVLSLFAATRSLFDFSEADVWSMFHSFAFDFSVWEMWGALLHGGCVVIVADTVAKDPAAFRALLRDEGVTVLSQTPTAFKVLMDEERKHPDRLPLRWITFGGEALRFPDLEPWIAKYGDETPKLVNMYGITETTVHASHRRVTSADLGEPASLIGVPLPGSEFHLVDRELVAVQHGQVGEIVVVGPGVGLGYLGQPELTGQRFPLLTGHDGNPVRGYRSGDLARRRPDGDLEYLGRADEQVKVRGFRIELGDIEAALARHPAVRAAAVVMWRTPAGDDALAGYVVPASDGTPDEHHLRTYLSGLLPDYMVPAAFTTLAALPMTVNGKLDRSALPEPRGADPAAGGRVPRSLREELLCQLFAQVLGRPAVGIDDDFFTLGAHSLSAVRLVNRIRAVLGLDFTIQDVFEARTVASLAARAESGISRPALTRPALTRPALTRPALTRQRRGGEVPLSAAQQEVWQAYRGPGPIPADQTLCTLRISGRVDVPALGSAVRDVLARHEILRTVYPRREGLPVQRILAADGSLPGLVVVHTTAERLDEAINGIAEEGFDLATETPVRAALFVVDADHSVLALVLHHIAVDAWSLRPLFGELLDAYTGRLGGQRPAWPPLPVQYADYALWQRELLGAGTTPDGPTGPSPAQASLAPSDPVRVEVDADLHSRLADLARTSGTTVQLVLQAAVAAVLTRSGTGTDLAIGVTVAGRTDESLRSLVGRFARTLVIRVDASGDPGFATLLRRVLIANLAVHDHQDLPAERPARPSGPQWTPTGGPVTHVTVGTRPRFDPRVDVPGLVVTPGVRTADVAWSDLSFTFEERGGTDAAPQGLACVIGYRADRFDRATVQRLGDRLIGLTQAALADLGAPLSELGLPHDGGTPEVPSGANAGPRVARSRVPDVVRQLVADALDVPLGHIDDDFIQLLAGGGGKDAVQPVLPLRGDGEREPLFCLHPSSGLCWSYVGLLRHVPPDFPVYGIQSAGLLHPDRLPDTVELMAAGYVDAIRAIQPRPPYHLIGWSLGGLLAFEIAVQLQRRGAEVGLLALLDCYPKTADDGPAGITGAPGLAGALELVGREINAPASLVESRVSALLRTAYHNRRLATGYVPGFFDGSLLFFRADADRAAGRTADLWTGSVRGDVTAHAVPATHMAMMDPAPLAQVGRALSVALARL